MKNIKSWLTIAFVTIAVSMSAQDNPSLKEDNLQLSYSKTTSIVFPYPVKSVDRGSQDVLVQ
ncbi:conjugative transposon protein TraN, partial [Flavobacterium sp. HMWF030]